MVNSSASAELFGFLSRVIHSREQDVLAGSEDRFPVSLRTWPAQTCNHRWVASGLTGQRCCAMRAQPYIAKVVAGTIALSRRFPSPRLLVFRFGIAVLLCLGADRLLVIAQPCLAGLQSLTDLMWCLPSIHLQMLGPMGWKNPHHYLSLAVPALIVVAAWTATDYGRPPPSAASALPAMPAWVRRMPRPFVFAFQLVVVFAICVAANAFLLLARPCLVFATGLDDMPVCYLLMFLVAMMGSVPDRLSDYVPLFVLAVVITIAWNMRGYWLRR
jgi:hypothetical protein